MRNNDSRTIRLTGSDYARSRERLEKLQQIVVEGEDAKVVLTYAERFLEIVKEETLDNLKKDVDQTETIALYKAANKFVDMIKSTIAIGEQKSKIRESLLQDK